MGGEKSFIEQVQEGMRNQEFLVYYQPQYDSLRNRIVAAEALARWRKPDGSIVEPEEFIVELEQSDAILELDWYILGEICTFLQDRRKKKKPCVSVAVNFSKHHIQEPQFHDQLCRIVDDYGLPRHLIQIEITESMMLHDTDRMIAVIWDLRSSGFNVAIDNFGSGLSSLSLVKDSAANIIKIDQALLSENCQTRKEQMVLESIIDFAHRLNITTVAEGVETEEQLKFLRSCNCRRIQGFLYSEPVPQEEFAAMCDEGDEAVDDVDILNFQTPAGANRLLFQAVYQHFSHVMLINATKNSCSVLICDGDSRDVITRPEVEHFEEWVKKTAASLHPEDKALFTQKLSVHALLEAHEQEKECVSLRIRCQDAEGVCKYMEISCYFVHMHGVEDVLALALIRAVGDLEEAEAQEFSHAVENEAVEIRRDIEVRR